MLPRHVTSPEHGEGIELETGPASTQAPDGPAPRPKAADRRQSGDSSISEYLFLFLPFLPWVLFTIAFYVGSRMLIRGTNEAIHNMQAAANQRVAALRVGYLAAHLLTDTHPPVGYRLRIKDEAEGLLRQQEELERSSAAPWWVSGFRSPYHKAHQALFFGKGCMRAGGFSGFSGSACRDTSDQFYSLTNRGLDVLVREFAKQAQMLAGDVSADLNVTNEKYRFVWEVGGTDLSDGLKKSFDIFTAEAAGRAQMAQLLLILACALLTAVLWVKLQPGLYRTVRTAVGVVWELIWQLLPGTPIRKQQQT